MRVSCWFLLILETIIPLVATAQEDSKARRVVARGGCTQREWERPPSCHETPTFQFQLHWVPSYKHNEKTNETTIHPFPEDLKGPVQAAVDLWSRAITGRNEKKTKKLNFIKMHSNSLALHSKAICGDDSIVPTAVKKQKENSTIPTIVLCMKFEFDPDPDTIASAAPDSPILGSVVFNSQYQGVLDFCDWANVAFHEIAHALGFAWLSRFRNTFRGLNAKREWDKLVVKRASTSSSATVSPPYPFLSPDGSHWSDKCFDSEVLLPTLYGGMGRVPLSRLTLAAMEDIGYEVTTTALMQPSL